MTLNRDDIRAAVSSGTISEAQAAGILALSDARRGMRENLSGVDEPFELFKGFNEVFIVVGLTILYSGWTGITGGLSFALTNGSLVGLVTGVISLAVLAGLSYYFTLVRRMVAPSIALSIMTAISGWLMGLQLSYILLEGLQLGGPTPLQYSLTSGFATAIVLGFWFFFRVPFSMFLAGLGVFSTAFALTTLSGASLDDPTALFLLSADGPFSILTIVIGLVGFAIALAFDMSDPHRVTRRAAQAFWLHVLAAPAIVNTIALTLFTADTLGSLLALVAFLAFIALVAVVIDRRSFLVSGVGYVVALAVTVTEGQAYLIILVLGVLLTLLGAFWEKLRRGLMNSLPIFPGKTKLPPWDILPEPEPQ